MCLVVRWPIYLPRLGRLGRNSNEKKDVIQVTAEQRKE